MVLPKELGTAIRSIAEASPDLVLLLDADGIIRYANRPLPGTTTPQLEGASIYAHLKPEQRSAVRTCLDRVRQTLIPDTFESTHVDGAGKTLLFESRVGPLIHEHEFEGFAVFARDITKPWSLELQLLQAQKMDAIGRLSGGVVHDLNNLIMAMQANAKFARDNADDPDARERHLQKVEEAAERGVELIAQIRRLARRDQAHHTPLALDRAVERVVELARRVIPANIEIDFESNSEGAEIEADATQLEQLMLNLVLNARDAMPGGGRLTLRTQKMRIERPRPNAPTWAPRGDVVQLTVNDNGEGMTREVQERAFEPFFTTKGAGEGTGLGLATANAIVRQHRGSIHVNSTPGAGTTFRIYFPLASLEEHPPPLPPPAPAEGGNEVVLLAEDNALVRDVVFKCLRRAGYEVVLATDGAEAVKLFEQDAERIQIVILDVVMPNATGPEAYETMRTHRPDLPVIFTSGYRDTRAEGHAVPIGARVLTKPFQPDVILQHIREALDGL